MLAVTLGSFNAFLALLALVSFTTVVSSPVEPGASAQVARDQDVWEPSSYFHLVSELQSDVNISFVQNSGVCETTPGVQQMSGYIDIGTNMSIVCSLLFLVYGMGIDSFWYS